MSQTMNEDLNVIANSDLEITYLDGDLAIIQQLDDEPNDVGGLTSAQLKAKFDQAGLAIQSYLNNTLIPELLAADATEAAREAAEAGRQAAEQTRVTAETARAAAEQERVNTTSGIVAQATQKAQEAAASAVRAEQVALGNIPDGSLAKAKLVQEVQNAVNRAAAGGEIDGLLAGKAPAWFGLGETEPKSVSSWDEAIQNGWYSAPAPEGYGSGTIWGFVSNFNSSYLTQTVYMDSRPNCVAMRERIDSTWKPWEWVNPPMQLGVEYRTTERYQGKPVYYKLWNYGYLPATATLDVAHGIENIKSIWVDLSKSVITVSANFPDSSHENLSPMHPLISRIHPRLDSEGRPAISITTTGNAVSNYRAALCLKYTKTTD